MPKCIALSVLSLVLAFLLVGVASADSPVVYRGTTVFVESGGDEVAGNSFSFIFNSNDTIPFNIDHSGMVIRNSDTTNGNYAYLSFQGNDSAGARYHGGAIITIFNRHVAGPLGEKNADMAFFLRKPQSNGGSFGEIMRLRWDPEQGGASLSLGIDPIRQGLGMPPQLPLYWALDGHKLVSWKPARDANYQWRLNTLQIGDNNNLGGATYIAAPSVASGANDIAGTSLVLEGGNSRGAGAGGSLVLAVASAGGTGIHTANGVVELAGLSNPVLRPLVDNVTPLGDARHRWSVVNVGNDVIVNGVSFLSLIARIDALERRMVIQEAVRP